VVDSLFQIRKPIQAAGAPTPEQLARMAPYLSAELRDLLAQAHALHQREVAAHPDEKPAFADGDLFTSLFEGPSSFTVGADSTAGAEHRISVHFTYEGATPPTVWNDQVVVRSENGRFVVGDVLYGGSWDFANRGSLVSSLQTALNDERK
jgi:hypothetical protein